MTAELAGRIRQFVIQNFYVAEPQSLLDDASLLDRGVIDSTGVLELIGFLEREFAISVADEEMLPENLDSIDRIAGYVGRKIG
ncbi:MAG TPA: acyl carrier protein [Myxococcales bacterium]|nr:acyl carrier protein [Myxococcales bacterium]